MWCVWCAGVAFGSGWGRLLGQDCWAGLLDWTAGLDSWAALLDVSAACKLNP